MKCNKCGAELATGVAFCRECGAKVEQPKRFCRECGAELKDGSKFCMDCGAKVDFKDVDEEKVEEIVIENEHDFTENVPSNSMNEIVDDASLNISDDKIEDTAEKSNEYSYGYVSDSPVSEKPIKSDSLGDKIKGKALNTWNGFDLFCKIVTVGMGLSLLLFLISIFSHKTLPIVISILQIAGLVVAVLLHKEKIHSPKSWLKYVVLVIALLCTLVNIKSYSLGTKGSESNHTSENKAEQMEWSSFTLSKLLPEPQSNKMELVYDSKEWFNVTVYDITKENYNEYVNWCKKDYGFTIDSSAMDDFFTANNKEGYSLVLTYTESSKELSIDLNEPSKETSEDYSIDYTDAESFEKALNDGEKVNGKVVQFLVLDYKPDSALGINCWAGEHLNFISEEELDVVKGKTIVGRVTKEPSQTLGSWKIPYEVLSISEEVTEIETTEDSESTDSSSETEIPKIKLTMNADEFEGMKKKDAKKKFEEMGFTKFENESVDTETESKDNTICYVEITEFLLGDSNFSKGDEFDADSTVKFYTYKYQEPEKEEVVENLTVDNCPELAAMLSNKAEIDSSYSSFASKYKGQNIEFDGRIDYCAKHENYNTRFDYLVSAGDYDPDHQIGPTFKFEDVNYYDLNTDLDTVSVGLNVHIVAEVKSFDSNSGLFYLDPVSVTGR